MRPRYILLLLCLIHLSLSLHARQRHALLIGISQYPHESSASVCCWDDIHGANDVDLMKQTLLAHQGFVADDITTLRNAQATASAIRAQLRLLTQQCQPGDLVYIHFSCHGQPYEDLNADEADGWDESLVPYDARKCYTKGVYEGANHIRDDELHSYLTALRTRLGSRGMLYVALDACHIGEAYKGDEYVRGTNQVFSPHGVRYVRSDVQRANQRDWLTLPSRQGDAAVCMLEACHADELNMEKRVGRTYYGALSYHIAQVLGHTSLDASTAWWELVREQMDADPSLINQTLVVETSLKR